MSYQCYYDEDEYNYYSDNDSEYDYFYEEEKVVVEEEKKVVEKKIIPVVIAPWANVKHPVVSFRSIEKENQNNSTPISPQKDTKQNLNKEDEDEDEDTFKPKKLLQQKNTLIKQDISTQYQKTNRIPYSDLKNNSIHVETPNTLHSSKKICNSFLQKKKCYNKYCQYAHSLTELVPDLCYKNCHKDDCNYIHTNESVEDYYNRLYTQIESLVKTPPIKRLFVKNKQPIEENITIKKFSSPYLKSTVEIEQKSTSSTLERNKNDTDEKKKTKFCQHMIDNGKCHKNRCTYAHTMAEIVFPSCAFADECKKTSCKFFHPTETLETYQKRIGFTVPPNIK